MARTAEMTAEMAEFGNRLRAKRLERGLSQEELGRISGIHRTYTGSAERGERNVALINILRFARALEVDPAYFVTGLDSTSPPPADREDAGDEKTARGPRKAARGRRRGTATADAAREVRHAAA